jgi:hypothetical protein
MKKIATAALICLVLLSACNNQTEPPIPEPPGTELVKNGGFETDVTGWTVFTENNGVAEQGRINYCIKSGTAYGALGGVGKSAQAFARAFFSQKVSIPATGTTTLRYNVHINTLEPAGSDKDTFTAFIDGSIIKTIRTNDPRDKHVLYTFDLSDYKGKDITVKFEGFNNESNNTVFCLDDISVKHVQ